MRNKVHPVNYTAGYICFKKRPDFIDLDTINYDIVTSLKPANFLLDPVGE